MFSIDMYVADVATGRIGRKLVETTSDPHFDSLQFLGSAGDWAPDNRRFVFAALSTGQPVLTIVDTDQRRSRRRVRVQGPRRDLQPGVVAGRQADRLLGAARAACSICIVYTLGDQRRCSSSPTIRSRISIPSGRLMAARSCGSTDRFSSNLDTLSFGNYRLGAMLAARRVQPRAARRLRHRPQLESGVRRRRLAVLPGHAGRHSQRLSPAEPVARRIAGARHQRRVRREPASRR